MEDFLTSGFGVKRKIPPVLKTFVGFFNYYLKLYLPKNPVNIDPHVVEDVLMHA